MVMSNLFEDEDILRCLRTGADPNAQASGPPRWTPLHGAALENTNPDITAALLRAGANPTALTAAGKTPIDVARETGNLSIAAMLEGSLNSRGNSPASDSGAGLTAGNFGNDSGRFANDGECDDIRFVGDRGGAASTSDNYIGRDATDCRNLLNAGRISWSGTAPGGGLPATAPQAQGLPAPSLSAGGGTGQAQDPSTCLQAELGEVEPLNDREGGWTTFWYTVRNRCDREIFYWATVHGVTSTGDSVEGATERGFSYVSSARVWSRTSRGRSEQCGVQNWVWRLAVVAVRQGHFSAVVPDIVRCLQVKQTANSATPDVREVTVVPRRIGKDARLVGGWTSWTNEDCHSFRGELPMPCSPQAMNRTPLLDMRIAPVLFVNTRESEP